MIRKVAMLTVVAALAAGGCGAAGERAAGPVKVPPALPADVPLPERAALRMARDQGEKGITLGFEAQGPVAAVAAEVRARLQAQGWARLSEVVHEGAVFESYRKSGRSVAIGVSRAGEVTVIGISYRQAPPAGEGEQG